MAEGEIVDTAEGEKIDISREGRQEGIGRAFGGDSWRMHGLVSLNPYSFSFTDLESPESACLEIDMWWNLGAIIAQHEQWGFLFYRFERDGIALAAWIENRFQIIDSTPLLKALEDSRRLDHVRKELGSRSDPEARNERQAAESNARHSMIAAGFTVDRVRLRLSPMPEDGVNSETGANNQKKRGPVNIPSEPYLWEFCWALRDGLRKGRKQQEIAVEFCNSRHDVNVESALAQVRARYRHLWDPNCDMDALTR